MKAENRLEFLGAFVFWTLNGFRGQMSDHYSHGNWTAQIINFMTGWLVIIVAAIFIHLIID
jgi:hypothetical protein